MSDTGHTTTSFHVEPAPAKLNLTLRVLGRRDDGYHEISSLVAFADLGERLTFAPADATSLEVSGPEAASLSDHDNLVLAADRAFRERFAGLIGEIAYRLDKHIPVAAGLGGGSADAAAALRGLARLADIDAGSPGLHEIAMGLGADVPVCLASRTSLMTGLGETVFDLGVKPTFAAVLVNPRIAVSTAEVFTSLGLKPGVTIAADSASPPATAQALRDAVIAGGNDLEPAANRIAPAIATVLQHLGATPGCITSRMSGSGATCFGLCDDLDAATHAQAQITAEQPDWWSRAVTLA